MTPSDTHRVIDAVWKTESAKVIAGLARKHEELEECARDLPGGQTSEQAERERNSRLGREDRMAGREDETEEVVADVIVDGRHEIRGGHLLMRLELAPGGEEIELTLAALPLFPKMTAFGQRIQRGSWRTRHVALRGRKSGPIEGEETAVRITK